MTEPEMRDEIERQRAEIVRLQGDIDDCMSMMKQVEQMWKMNKTLSLLEPGVVFMWAAVGFIAGKLL